MELTGIATEIHRASKQEGWEQNNEKFLDKAEHWLPEVVSEDDINMQKHAANYLASLLSRGKNKGIMDNPEQVTGKKNKPAYNKRPKALANKLRQILGIS